MVLEKLNHFFGLNDEEEDTENQAYTNEDSVTTEIPQNKGNLHRDNVVSLQDHVQPQKSQILLYEPRVFSDAKDVAQNLLSGKAVIVNFSRMEDEPSRRVVDFVTGTVYALGGKIQRVGDKIFLATPPKFETDGKITDMLDKKDQLG